MSNTPEHVFALLEPLAARFGRDELDAMWRVIDAFRALDPALPAQQQAAQARAQAAQQTRMSQAPVTRKERRAAAARGASLVPGATLPEPVTVKREGPKLGRNDPCHCGSGKKYKSCHYQEDRALEASGG